MKKLIFMLCAIFMTVTACARDGKNISTQEDGEAMKITITINGKDTLNATLADNPSAKAFAELLQKGSVTVEMHGYGGFEQVGSLPKSLPRNDTQISTEPGDIMLYQGNQVVMFYGTNAWAYTRLGKIGGVTQSELKKILGTGNIKAEFALAD